MKSVRIGTILLVLLTAVLARPPQNGEESQSRLVLLI